MWLLVCNMLLDGWGKIRSWRAARTGWKTTWWATGTAWEIYIKPARKWKVEAWGLFWIITYDFLYEIEWYLTLITCPAERTKP